MPLCCVVPVTHNRLVKTTVSKHCIPCSQSFFLALSLIICPPVLSLLTSLDALGYLLFHLFSAQFRISALCALSQTLFRFMGQAQMGRRQSWKGSVQLFWISEMKFITTMFRSLCFLYLGCTGDIQHL